MLYDEAAFQNQSPNTIRPCHLSPFTRTPHIKASHKNGLLWSPCLIPIPHKGVNPACAYLGDAEHGPRAGLRNIHQKAPMETCPPSHKWLRSACHRHVSSFFGSQQAHCHQAAAAQANLSLSLLSSFLRDLIPCIQMDSVQ